MMIIYLATGWIVVSIALRSILNRINAMIEAKSKLSLEFSSIEEIIHTEQRSINMHIVIWMWPFTIHVLVGMFVLYLLMMSFICVSYVVIPVWNRLKTFRARQHDKVVAKYVAKLAAKHQSPLLDSIDYRSLPRKVTDSK